MSVTFLTNKDGELFSNQIGILSNIALNTYSNALSVSLWGIGGLQTADGGINSLNTRMRTPFLINEEYVIDAPSDMTYRVYRYNVTSASSVTYLGCTESLSGLRLVGGEYTDGANALRVLASYIDNRDMTEDDFARVSIRTPKHHMLYPQYTTGTLAGSTGTEVSYSSRCRTGYLPVEPLYIVPDDGYKFFVHYYDINQIFVGKLANDWSETAMLMNPPENVAYIRIVAATVAEDTLAGTGYNISNLCGMHIRLYTDASQEYLKAKLDNFGADNAGSEVGEVYDHMYCEDVDVAWGMGGLQSADGTTNGLTTRIRTGSISPKYLRVTSPLTVEYIYYYYGDTTLQSYLGTSGSWMSGATNAMDYAMAADAKSVRLVVRNANNSTIADKDELASLVQIKALIGTSVKDTTYNDYASDIPESMGVLNTILNFKQLAEVKFTTMAELPIGTVDGDHSTHYAAGATKKGIPYSSERVNAGFVPNFVSMHTFMTALKNPNSYLYTVDINRDYGNINGHTYYGTVCSVACGYAMGITPNYSTHQWAQVPGMEALECQSVYALKLGDTICGKGHVIMITDITRNGRGRIGRITVTEAAPPCVHSTMYTPDELATKYPTSDYTYYRYKYIHEVEHAQLPYVAVEDEVSQEVVYNTAIIPRKGDKANWLVGEPVEIDVLESDNYTSVEIYKDEALYDTLSISALITLSNLPYGSYKARLTDGTNTSDWCYWMVVDASINVTATGNDGEIKVDYTASNAAPLFVAWCKASNKGTEHISIPTDEELEAKSAVCTHKTGSYAIRVAFRTEYGIIHSALSDAVTV